MGGLDDPAAVVAALYRAGADDGLAALRAWLPVLCPGRGSPAAPGPPWRALRC